MNHVFSEEQISMLVQNIPKYMYIKLTLINQIQTGELPVGMKLPTEKEMCLSYACSRLTVRKALEELQREGYINKVQGLGTFVKERNPQKQDLSSITSCSSLIRSQNMIPSKKNPVLCCDPQHTGGGCTAANSSWRRCSGVFSGLLWQWRAGDPQPQLFQCVSCPRH